MDLLGCCGAAHHSGAAQTVQRRSEPDGHLWDRAIAVNRIALRDGPQCVIASRSWLDACSSEPSRSAERSVAFSLLRPGRHVNVHVSIWLEWPRLKVECLAVRGDVRPD